MADRPRTFTVHEFHRTLRGPGAKRNKRSIDSEQTTSFETLERRMQLPVYYQLRWKEIIAKLEAVFSRQEQPSDWLLSQSAAFIRRLRPAGWIGVFLVELAPRFWRLSLQVRTTRQHPLTLEQIFSSTRDF